MEAEDRAALLFVFCILVVAVLLLTGCGGPATLAPEPCVRRPEDPLCVAWRCKDSAPGHLCSRYVGTEEPCRCLDR